MENHSNIRARSHTAPLCLQKQKRAKLLPRASERVKMHGKEAIFHFCPPQTAPKFALHTHSHHAEREQRGGNRRPCVYIHTHTQSVLQQSGRQAGNASLNNSRDACARILRRLALFAHFSQERRYPICIV